ncbi:MAG: hypothetical protein KJO75_18165 [Dactylosporangium sp.]|nr:hypothetical protein [Dactylosporangium sp.]
MHLPLCRSHLEAHLYMDLHPCECGTSDFDRGYASAREGEWQVRYRGSCAGCGRLREFAFRVAECPPRPLDGAWSEGGQPSELLDPGEWLWVADQLAEHPIDPTDLSDEQARRRLADLDLAAGAVDEALLFVPPGAGSVPVEALGSARGRAMHDAAPERFDRVRLDTVRDVYRALAGEREPRFTGQPLRARTIGEAHLFMDMHRCACGEGLFERSAQRFPRAGDADDASDADILVYTGTCPACGRCRTFMFSLPQPADGSGPEPMGCGFGRPDDAPSAVLDAGHWWVAGQLYARLRQRADLPDPSSPEVWREAEARRAMVELLATSVAVVDEMLRFIPPGADRVPAEAFWTATGRIACRDEPEQFTRDRLLAERAARERDLVGFRARCPEPPE